MGSGAVGGYYGAVLRHAGNEVTFVARGDHLAAIRERGLRVDSVTSGNFTVTADATDRPDTSVSPDLVLFCVKGYDNATAIELIRPVVGDSTTVLTLQNGIGSGAQLAEAFGEQRVMLGVTYVDASLEGPGHVAEFGGPSRLVFGEVDGRETSRATAIRDTLSGAGVRAELTSDVDTALWRKFLFICAWSGMICVTRSAMAEILESPATERMTLDVLREVQSVADARGIELSDDEVEEAMQSFRDAGEDSVSSMNIDLRAGKPLEIEVLNGAVSRMGAEARVATPVNDFITACLTLPHQRALAARAGGP